MKILIDADGCPVVDIAVAEAKKRGIECLILCDTAHYFSKDGATTIGAVTPRVATSRRSNLRLAKAPCCAHSGSEHISSGVL